MGPGHFIFGGLFIHTEIKTHGKSVNLDANVHLLRVIGTDNLFIHRQVKLSIIVSI